MGEEIFVGYEFPQAVGRLHTHNLDNFRKGETLRKWKNNNKVKKKSLNLLSNNSLISR